MFKTLYDVVGDKVIKFWNDNGFVDPVVCFFDIKYDYEETWEHIRVIAEPENMEVCFQWDFFEGQTDIKDIKIAYLEDIFNKYEEENKDV